MAAFLVLFLIFALVYHFLSVLATSIVNWFNWKSHFIQSFHVAVDQINFLMNKDQQIYLNFQIIYFSLHRAIKIHSYSFVCNFTS
jgi:hypothetical protein